MSCRQTEGAAALATLAARESVLRWHLSLASLQFVCHKSVQLEGEASSELGLCMQLQSSASPYSVTLLQRHTGPLLGNEHSTALLHGKGGNNRRSIVPY
jgi:hypothetical protein